jgi:ABC-type multidrug transport system fused ATPase/permease subunit
MDIFRGDRYCITPAFGARRIVHGWMTPGIFVAFIIAVFKLYDPVRKFALFHNSFQQALGASSEIFKFMDVKDEVRESLTRSRSAVLEEDCLRQRQLLLRLGQWPARGASSHHSGRESRRNSRAGGLQRIWQEHAGLACPTVFDATQEQF